MLLVTFCKWLQKISKIKEEEWSFLSVATVVCEIDFYY